MELLQQVQDRQEQVPGVDTLDGAVNYQVEGPCFTLTLPAYWQQWAQIRKETNYIQFRERISSETSYGGHLFTLELAADQGYTESPSYRVVGYIDSENGEHWTLVAHFPTDVQSAPGAQALYHKMYGEFDSIVVTLIPAAGYHFTPA